MNDTLKQIIRKYLFTIIPSLAVVVAILLINDFANLETLQDKYRVLANSFTTPGVCLIMIGIIVLISREGTFDMLTYGISKAYYRFNQRSDRYFETFYDYKERLKAKERGSVWHLFIVGAVLTVVAIVFTLLYHTV